MIVQSNVCPHWKYSGYLRNKLEGWKSDCMNKDYLFLLCCCPSCLLCGIWAWLKETTLRQWNWGFFRLASDWSAIALWAFSYPAQRARFANTIEGRTVGWAIGYQIAASGVTSETKTKEREKRNGWIRDQRMAPKKSMDKMPFHGIHKIEGCFLDDVFNINIKSVFI